MFTVTRAFARVYVWDRRWSKPYVVEKRLTTMAEVCKVVDTFSGVLSGPAKLPFLHGLLLGTPPCSGDGTRSVLNLAFQVELPTLIARATNL